ncbi:Rqc1p, partial [Ascoidea rubescens DSM 1968]
MSSRALRKLEKQYQQEHPPSDHSGQESDIEDQIVKPAFNPFDLLMDNESSDDETHQDQQNIADKSPAIEPHPEESQENQSNVTNTIAIPSSKAKKKKKKKKNKNKLKARNPVNANNQSQSQSQSQGENNDIHNDYDKDNSFVQLIDPHYMYFNISKLNQSIPLLQFDIKDLDPDREFQQLFGKLSLEAIEDAESTTSTFIRPEELKLIKRLQHLTKGWGGKDRRSIPGTSRKLALTRIRDDWLPTVKKEISMIEFRKNDILNLVNFNESDLQNDSLYEINNKIISQLNLGVKYFKFDKTIATKLVDANFFYSVMVRPDQESLISLLYQNPYHVQTILQVSSILSRNGQKNESSSLIERALFVFDRGLKQNFELGKALSRLPFNFFLNRQFYLTLFRHIVSLAQKGTFYTALTFCKLLLSLSPDEDPYGVRYFIDFYAIMAGEYKYLVDFANNGISTTYERWYTPGIAFSLSLAHLFLDNKTEAEKTLKFAFKKYPYTAYQLLDRIGKISDIPIKNSKISTITPEIEIATETYLTRAGLLWNEPGHIDFLAKNLTTYFHNLASSVEIYQNLNNEIPRNLIRHAILSAESSVMGRLPREIWEMEDIYDFDVLPPSDSKSETYHDLVDDEAI